MAEGVGTDNLVDACRFGLHFDNVEHHDAGQFGTPAETEENIIFVAVLGLDVGALLEIALQLVDGTRRDGYQALLAAFPQHTDKAFAQIKVVQAEIAQLTDTQTTTVEYLQNGAVALSLGLAEVDGIDDIIYLLHRKDIGQLSAKTWILNQFGRVGLYIILQHKETVE